MSEPTVVVVTGDSEPEPIAEPTVVVVAPEPPSDAAPVVEAVIDHAERIAALEAENAELRGRVGNAEVDAAVALDIATEPVAPPVVDVEPVVEVPDEPPQTKHPFFQSFDELRSND